jgi:transposase InsO family protein
MKEHQKIHTVEMMARVFEVSRSGYYAWKKREKSKRDWEDEILIQEITRIQKKVKYRYGSPRVTAELKRRGFVVGHNRIARLMRENGLRRRARKRFRSTTQSNHTKPVAENLLNREFSVDKPNKVWASDITYIATAEGWLYLCVFIDLFSRKVVGWSMSTRLKTDFVLQALMMGILSRKPPKGLIVHSDRGSQYCGNVFRRRLNRYGYIQSMSRKGDCWDNAPVESFFKTLKEELCGHRSFRSRREARTAIFEYVEVFYNRVRLHSTLGYCTPDEYERNQWQKAA